MRHNKKFNHLSRKSAHRKAMLSNMAASLIQHKKIVTTTAKAKALKIYVEPLLTKAKEDTTHNRRTVFAYLQNKKAVTELFKEVSQKIADRPGGYTRILRTGFRLGDAAEMCVIELVDYNENMLKEKAAKKASRTRRSKKSTAADDATPKAEVKKAPAKAKVVKEVKEELPAAEAVVEEVKEEVAPAAEAVVEKVKEEVAPAAEAVVEEVKDALEEEAPAETENAETSEEEKA